MSERYRAARDLIEAGDRLRLLEACEHATGKPFATGHDWAAVLDASARWTMARGHGHIWALRVARRRLRWHER